MCCEFNFSKNCINDKNSFRCFSDIEYVTFFVEYEKNVKWFLFLPHETC